MNERKVNEEMKKKKRKKQKQCERLHFSWLSRPIYFCVWLHARVDANINRIFARPANNVVAELATELSLCIGVTCIGNVENYLCK